MESENKELIARLTREGRASKGYSQQELSDLAGISLRSVQRIEQGQVMPRPYTIRVLAEHLGFSEKLGSLRPDEPAIKLPEPTFPTTRKIIMSVGSGLILAFCCFAFLAQSAHFPETQFELFCMIAAVLAVYVTALYVIWR